MNPAVVPNGSLPTAVLVHGAFTDGSSWARVTGELQAAGIPVVAPPNPLRGAAADAESVAGVVAEIAGPVLLVGHSYGGVVIDRVAVQAANAVGLVYVAAYALDVGESALALAGRFPATLLAAALRPVPLAAGDGGSATDLYLRADRFAETFAADLPREVTAVAAVAQRPVAAAALEEPSPVAAWASLPAWFVVATADRAIHPDAQRFMAQRAGAATLELDASHAVALARPTEVAAHIHAAAVVTRGTLATVAP